MLKLLKLIVLIPIWLFFVLIMVFRAAADTNLLVKAEERTFRCIFQVGIRKLDSNMAQFSLESL